MNLTPASFAYRRSYNLGGGYSAEFVLNGASLSVRWSPDLPRGKTAKRLRASYRAARDRFLASTGIRMMVVEL
ncbi:MAG: hypothetical protein KGL48_14015 [Sphingomonadales bacterium]|nr:hypothetical protein [Sphingomonadales bacterium]